MPLVLAVLTGVVCAMMFSLKPLLDLFDIPPLRVLRRNLGDKLAISRIHLTLSAATVFMLMLIYSRDWVISLVFFASSALLAAVLFLVSRLILSGSRKLGLKPSSSWSLAIASLQKRANENSVQLISFALAIKLMLFLMVMKNDLIADWQAQLPQNAPNAFLVNINHTELNDVTQYLAARDIETSAFYPVVRGRVNGINGELVSRHTSIQENEKRDEEARGGVGRELNLTWTNTLPSQNDVVKGSWFGANAQGEASIEEKMAERLNVDIGDTLDFLIGSERFSAKITSIRKVNWSSMQPNFFIVLSPDVLASFPATYFSAVHIEPSQKKTLHQLVGRYPTISVIDVDTIIKQIQDTITQVSQAISFVLIVVLVCGSLVLISQVQASLQERMQEIVILRTLGAPGRLIKNAVLVEFLLLGLFAGFVAALFSELTLYIVQYLMFDKLGVLHPSMWLVGPLVGASFVAVLGYSLVAAKLKQNTLGLVRAL
jgi:putative ABC transport system permease protein